jgi:hypothetical protein
MRVKAFTCFAIPMEFFASKRRYQEVSSTTPNDKAIALLLPFHANRDTNASTFSINNDMTLLLRSDPHRVPGELTAHADIRKAQPKLHDTLQTKSTTTMRRTAVPEAVHIILDTRTLGVNRRVMFAHHFSQQVGIVDTLGTGQDLLSTHEHVVRVRELWVGGRGHGVRRANSQGKFVQNVKVRASLFENEASEFLFLRRTVVIVSAVLRYVKS